MYIYYGLFFDALSAYMIHIKLNTIFYTHVEHSPTKTVYIKYYMEKKKKKGKRECQLIYQKMSVTSGHLIEVTL